MNISNLKIGSKITLVNHEEYRILSIINENRNRLSNMLYK